MNFDSAHTIFNLHPCCMKNAPVFSQLDAHNFFKYITNRSKIDSYSLLCGISLNIVEVCVQLMLKFIIIFLFSVRSFKPFVTLLQCALPAVQMWALWAIVHVCTRNGKYLLIPNCLNSGLANKKLRQDDAFDFCEAELGWKPLYMTPLIVLT